MTWCVKNRMTDAVLEQVSNLLHGPAVVVQGAQQDDKDLMAQVARDYPSRAFCIVRQWMIIDVQLSPEDLAKTNELGMAPTIIYSVDIQLDSQRRFPPGSWVRSTYQTRFEGCYFETRNTVYVLAGRGFRTRASLEAVAALG